MEDRKSGIDWKWLGFLFVGVLGMLIVLWYAVVFARSYTKLRVGADILGRESADISAYMYDKQLVSRLANSESFRGMMVSKMGCLRLWDGNRMRCYEIGSGVVPLIYLRFENNVIGKSLVGKLVESGWVEEKTIVSNNDVSMVAYVSDPGKVNIEGLLSMLRFGDIVRVTSNVDTGEVVSLVLVFRRGIL